MRIGVDFDNTIVCYDRLFHELAVERHLISPQVPIDKESVRNCLREQGREDHWTELQGYAYGTRIEEAAAFPGVREFFLQCRENDTPIYIISHKTRLPFRGPSVDLHRAARGWLESQGFHDPSGIALPAERVFFEETKEKKLQRIAREGCTHFIDDLPEFLQEPGFPDGVLRILFDPLDRHGGKVPFECFSSWDALRTHFSFR